MADVKIDHASFVSQVAKENYEQIARDIAKVNGGTPKAAMGELAKQFAEEHKKRPLDGYDHLAEWAKNYEPGPSAEDEALARELARAIESARREPKLAFQSHPEAVKAAEETLRHEDPATEPADGVIPNTGPVPVKATAKK